jgi:hypothetical protein
MSVDLDRQLARIALEVGGDLPDHGAATAAGDPRKLRGLPAIGYGVGGAIAGTQPERETLRRQRGDDG